MADTDESQKPDESPEPEKKEEKPGNGDYERIYKDLRYLGKLRRHIGNVQQSCYIIAEKLIERGDQLFSEGDGKNLWGDKLDPVRFGVELIANSMIHDYSKFRGLEWKFLRPQEDEPDIASEDRMKAVIQHHLTNPHHPEYWAGIDNMPDIHIAEMVCDWHARSIDFGSDLRQWIKDRAMERYGIKPKGKTWRKIKFFLDLLLDKPFS